MMALTEIRQNLLADLLSYRFSRFRRFVKRWWRAWLYKIGWERLLMTTIFWRYVRPLAAPRTRALHQVHIESRINRLCMPSEYGAQHGVEVKVSRVLIREIAQGARRQ